MIEQNISFHRLLIDCQRMYLTALHRLSVHDSVLCSTFFDLDEKTCSTLSGISHEEFDKICQSLNHWVLSSMTYKSQRSLSIGFKLDDWVDNVCAESSAEINYNNKFNYPDNLSIENRKYFDDILEAQSALLLSLGDSAYHSRGFTVGVTGIDNSLISKLVNSWFSPMKMRSLRCLSPVFTINKKINVPLFLRDGRESLLSVEAGIYSIN
ncbi:hypothetical protein [Shewanella sp. UCD-KL12]|uniref:hypothetical protein n=1 Tax=Shewanella sp. UCD-KL12 TaxID=1917163 RepID=UPI00117EBF61|nr:hypothetical protein [Shewanella sp. UCD-KL12]